MRLSTRRSSFTARKVTETGLSEREPAGEHGGNCSPQGLSGSAERSHAAGPATGEHGQPSGSDRDPAQPRPIGDFLDETLQFWRPRVSEDLTREDARQILANSAGFFSVLAEWAVTEDGDRALERQLPVPASAEDRE